jgi:hypothetical protein
LESLESFLVKTDAFFA